MAECTNDRLKDMDLDFTGKTKGTNHFNLWFPYQGRSTDEEMQKEKL